MRSLFVITFLLIATGVFAQTGSSVGTQDTSITQDTTLRPRWGTYIVGIFPSPAPVFQPITVQTFNLDPVEISVRVYDVIGRLMLELLPKQMRAGGLQTFTISPFLLASGEYLVKLETYTASDAVDIVDEAHFLIVH